MATNKHALIRYQALDACFSKKYKKYFIDDLIDACNNALQEYYISKEDVINDTEFYVRRRTIFDDISYMKSMNGYNAPIESIYEGHKCYYRYSDENFSINKKDFSEAELDKLDEALVMLHRLNGTAGFDWVDEFITNFEDKLGRKKNTTPVIGYERNPYLTGIGNLSILYNYIVSKQVLKITYQHFTKGKQVYVMHPYYLKQYNNRWFLFGVTEKENDVLTNLPIDRIEKVEKVPAPYIPNTQFDFKEYFEDVVGVSVPRTGKSEKIVLKFGEKSYPYVYTKPIHPSQKVLNREDHIIQLDVFQTPELESRILAFGDQVEVLKPASLREKMKLQIQNLAEKYNSAE